MVTSGKFLLNSKIMKKFWRNVKIFLRIRKSVKCLGKFQKILKIMRETFGKVLKKRKVNFEINQWKKIDNCKETEIVTRSLCQEIKVKFD